METFLQDLRFAARTLLRNPGFALVVLVVLSLGIAATSSVATVVSAVLLRDLPYPEADRLLMLRGFRVSDGDLETFYSSVLDARDWRERSTSFEDLGVYSSPLAFNLLTDGEPERVSGEIADSAYFRVLQVRPVLGRVLTPQDDAKPGAPRVVLLGHALWQRRFGGDRGVLGKSLLVDGEGYQIIGVLPPRFRGLTDEAEIWLPLTMSNDLLGDPRFLDRRGARWLEAVARLKDDGPIAAAQGEMDTISASLSREYPDTNENMIVRLETLRQGLFGDLRFPLLTLLGASAFVLLIAWTTVANLLLARATARQREIAVRISLGATLPRLLRQLLTENLVLSGLSCALGLLLAHWSTRLLVAASAVRFQSYVEIGLDPRVVLAVVVLSLLCGLGFGLAPAWLGLRGTITLREGSSSRGVARQRFQSTLVVAEVALACFLLIGAGLLIQGFQRFRQTELGFDPRNLLTVRVDLKGKRYADPQAMVRIARQYRERLQALPGVKTVAIEAPEIPTDGWSGSSFIVEDLLTRTKDGVAYLVFHYVTPGFFAQLGIPLLEGRDFTEADTERTPRAIVISRAMARKYWPAESPLGKRMKFGRRDPNAPWFTVIGVVGDLRHEAMQDSEWPGPDVYFSVFQFPPVLSPQLAFLIRTEGVPPLSLTRAVESELRAVTPDLVPYDADTLEHRLELFAAKGRFLVLLMSLYAGIALILAMVGLYGVLSYSVAQRTREMGIRVALGAQRRDVLRLVAGKAAALAGIGLAIGLAAALGLNRLFQSLLYGISPTDLATYLGIAQLLLLVALAAAWVPARRAMKVPPTIVLRME
jgi:predicted permease